MGHVAAPVEEGGAAIEIVRLERLQHHVAARVRDGRQELGKPDAHVVPHLGRRDGAGCRWRLAGHRAAAGHPLRQAAIQDEQPLGRQARVNNASTGP
jgi:hypothetical protein